MSKSVNDEKKARAIRQTNKADFLQVVNQIRDIVNADDFEGRVCELTANGLYKLTTECPQDRTGVKNYESQGVKWYKVPTTDYSVSFFSYLKFRLTNESKAKSEARKALANLSLEELQKLLALANAQK